MRLVDADEVKKCLEEVSGEDKADAIALLEWAINKRTVQAVPVSALEELREIRQEIEERINNCGDGTFKDGLCEAFDIVYCKMKELSE